MKFVLFLAGYVIVKLVVQTLTRRKLLGAVKAIHVLNTVNRGRIKAVVRVGRISAADLEKLTKAGYLVRVGG